MNTLEEYTDVVVEEPDMPDVRQHLPVQDSDFPQLFLP